MDKNFSKKRRVYRIALVVVTVAWMMQAATYARESLPSDQIKANTTSPGPQSGVRQLEVGKPIERELKGGESHVYEIALEAGQYLNAVVEQRGIDVVVTVTAPDGKPLLEVDSPNYDKGDEPVTLITEAAGIYRLKVNSLEKNAAAGKYVIRVKELRAATDTDRILQEATKLNQEVEKLYSTGKYDTALPLAERVLTIREHALGAKHPLTADSLNNLAELYRATGDYAKAEPLYLRALAIREQALGAEHPDTATSLNNLALLYQATGDYAKAEPLHLRALAIREKALGKEDPSTADSLNNLALLYYSKGAYAKAGPLYLRALAIYEKTLGLEHLSTADSLNNLAELYRATGDYAKAEPLYLRALAIYEKALGAEHPDTVTSLNNLALLYQTKGDYAKAEPLYLRALAIREKALGKEHRLIADSFNNLAELYRATGDYAKAEPLYLRALAIYEKALGLEHLSTADSLNNLANVYNLKGDYAKAEPLYLRALAIYKKALGAEHPSTATLFNNLALLYYSEGNYAKAEPLHIRALAICEKVLGKEHPSTATSLNNLALLYSAKGDYTKAMGFQSRCNDASDRDLTRNLASGSERQKLAYLNQTSRYTDFTISLQAQSSPSDIKAERAGLKVLLQRKGRALDAMADAFAALRRRLSPKDQELLNQFVEVRSQISVLALRGPGKEGLDTHKTNLKALEEQEEKLQNDISQRSAEFRVQSQTQSKSVTIEDVQKDIPQGIALIEFAQYSPVNSKEIKKEKRYGKPRYVAYVLPSQGESQWVELGDAESINRKIDDFRKALRDKRRRDVKRRSRAVDREVMQPVRQLLGRTRRVLISPDSALNLIPFAALVDEDGEYLIKKYHFTYLTSGRDLLRLQTKIESKTESVVMADADFNHSAGGNKSDDHQQTTKSSNGVNAANEANNAAAEPVGPKLGEVEFEPLKRVTASAGEAREVEKMLKPVTLLLRSKATEAALKRVSSPAILHIATHGFFLEEDVRSGSKSAESKRLAVRIKQGKSTLGGKLENPALRSGLFFAGANRGKSGDDDGVLTALEAAGLDLWGTKLVVLSACDTGIGEVLNGEGVQGLRRALVLAGSESQMMSLWPVSDSGTRELMIDYYKRLQAGQGRSQALRQAQLQMLKNPRRRHPFYWASFIQSGEWASLDGKR